MVKLHEYHELSQNLLGRLVGMDKATMQGVVRRLKDRGLVDSRPDPGDARRTLLSLTIDGQPLSQTEQGKLTNFFLKKSALRGRMAYYWLRRQGRS